MPRDTSIEFNTKVLDAILKNLGDNTHDAIAKVAFTIEGKAKVHITQMDAVDTGALRASVYTSIKGGNGDAAITEALSLNPEAGIVALPVPNDKTTAYVGPSVEYASDVHFGNGQMPGRPYLLRAVRDTEQDFAKMFTKVVTNK